MAQYCILYILSMSSFKTVYQMLDLCCLCLLITAFYCQLLETVAAGDGIRHHQIRCKIVLKFERLNWRRIG